MCGVCTNEAIERARVWAVPTAERDVPYMSGEAAIYSPEYLERREGNANGTQAHQWRVRIPRR